MKTPELNIPKTLEAFEAEQLAAASCIELGYIFRVFSCSQHLCGTGFKTPPCLCLLTDILLIAKDVTVEVSCLLRCGMRK